MKQIEHLPAVVSARHCYCPACAPDASPLARLDAKETRQAEPPGVCLLPFVPGAPRRQFVF